MIRRVTCLLLPLTLLTGCHHHHGSMEMPKKPAPAPQMKMLEAMVGTWSSSGEMVEPDPEAIKASMSESERANFKSTFVGGSNGELAMGGTALQMTGWYEMPEDQKGNYVEYWTWDAKKAKFRTWYTSDWSETGTGWATPFNDGKCFHVKGTGNDATGMKKSFEGCMCVVDRDTMEWQFTEKSAMGRFAMHGTNKRQK